MWNPISAIGSGIKKIGRSISGLGDESDSAKQQRAMMEEQAGKAGGFADQSQQGVSALGAEAQAQRDYLRRLAGGQDSVSAEQLRQGLAQNVAAQRSMAAGASPSMAPMAARTAAIQSARLGSGMAGQQAVAGLMERQQAQKALAEMILQQRQQDLQGALGGRQTAIGGYGGVKPEGSFLDKWGGAITGAATLGAKLSDERTKEGVRDGDKAANAALDALKAKSYRYKDPANGKGREVGIMAQNLEDAGLGHAIVETPKGKMVNGAALATSSAAMLAALNRRVRKLEGDE